MRTSVVNYVLYQAGWFACVIGAGASHPLLATTVGACLLLAHLSMAVRRRDEASLALVAAGLGLAVDALQIRLGTLRFPADAAHPSLHAALPPLWMPILWAQFATTLNFSLAWLLRARLRAAVFGLVGAPLVFLAGEGFGAVHIGEPRWLSLLVLAVLWSTAVPVITSLASRQSASDGAGTYRWDLPAGAGRVTGARPRVSAGTDARRRTQQREW